jgi:hypothetical protein
VPTKSSSFALRRGPEWLEPVYEKLGPIEKLKVKQNAFGVAFGVAGRYSQPFAAIICTADPAKADKRTRSKWSRLMRYAAAYKPDSEPLDQFVRRKGGINACAARFSRVRGARGSTQNRHQAGGAALRVGCYPKSRYDAASR